MKKQDCTIELLKVAGRKNCVVLDKFRETKAYYIDRYGDKYRKCNGHWGDKECIADGKYGLLYHPDSPRAIKLLKQQEKADTLKLCKNKLEKYNNAPLTIKQAHRILAFFDQLEQENEAHLAQVKAKLDQLDQQQSVIDTVKQALPDLDWLPHHALKHDSSYAFYLTLEGNEEAVAVFDKWLEDKLTP